MNAVAQKEFAKTRVRRCRRCNRDGIHFADQIFWIRVTSDAEFARDLCHLIGRQITDADQGGFWNHFIFLCVKSTQVSDAHNGAAEAHRAIPLSEVETNSIKCSMCCEG